MIAVTEVIVRKIFSSNRVKGTASITINNSIAINDIKIIESMNGMFIAMPSRKTPNGEFKDIVYPINAETRETIQKAILEEYENQKQQGADNI